MLIVVTDATVVIGAPLRSVAAVTITVAGTTLAAAARPEDAAVTAGLRLPIRRYNFLRAAVGREEKGCGSEGAAAVDRDAGGGEVGLYHTCFITLHGVWFYLSFCLLCRFLFTVFTYFL